MNEGPVNAQQIEYWNETAGPKWVEMNTILDVQIGTFGLDMLDAACLSAGRRVIDVGCGCGATSLEAAKRVGREGRVLGLDISGPMLARARERAAGEGLSNTEFVQGDAQVYGLEAGAYDAVVSRFGVMFFEDSVAAFANLGKGLRDGGRLAFACWKSPLENPWMTVPMAAVAPLMEMPAPVGEDEPGPFRFADDARLRGILEEAGYTDIAIEPSVRVMQVGGGMDLSQSVDFYFEIGPLSRILADASAEKKEEVRAALIAAMEPYRTDEGVMLEGATWIVSAVKA